ncbi:MAG: hypothetical protein ACTSSK_16695 [Candidatus Heimdallarchaeota archaeon]
MVKEKRLRILHDETAKEGELIKTTVEEDKIYGNPEELLAKGISDNSIATIRAPIE